MTTAKSALALAATALLAGCSTVADTLGNPLGIGNGPNERQYGTAAGNGDYPAIAFSRRDAPDAMASTTRSRSSKEHGFGIDPPPKIESMPLDSLIQTARDRPIQPSRNLL